MPKNERPPSVAKIVQNYMLERPLLMGHVAEGVINTSSLARKIKKETGIRKSDEAVMISLYRFLDKCKKWVGSSKDAEKIIKNTSANVHSDYAVAIVDGKFEGNADAIISFGKVSVAIGRANDLAGYEKRAKYYRENLVLIELRHSKNIEDTPGVLFHILSRFYEKEITIIEVFSAWDATYILMEKKNLKKVMEMFFA
ncbi:MAG: hypothetical protein ABIH83_01405 [Candidatus Micrarchaeota archaeon]